MTDLKTPHHWVPSPYGHGDMACTYCLATNREIAVIGDLNHCPDAHKAQFPATDRLEVKNDDWRSRGTKTEEGYNG